MPAGWIPWLDAVFMTAAGTAPNALGTLETYLAGTATPAATYSDSDLSVANPTTIDLDAAGRPETDIYLGAFGYKFILKTAGGVTIWTRDNIEDVGQVFAATYGNLETEGSKNQVSGYTVDPDTDQLVTMSSSGGANPCVVNLPAAADAPRPITIKNLGTIALAITPNGAETIDGIAAVYTVAASASPLFRTIELKSDGVNAWWVTGGIGV